MKLLGSAGSLEQIKTLIGRFFYSTNVTLTQLADGTYSVSTGKGVIEGCQVRVAKNRYRFEMESK